MFVTNISYGKAVVAFLRSRMRPGRRWLVTDTETQPKPGFESSDALIIGRADIYVWSLCYMGMSYSFPTNLIDPQFPLMAEWAEEVIRPYAEDQSIVSVFHNRNYDDNAIHYCADEPFKWKNPYCTMIGAWKANASVEKGLKVRAPLYGRHLGSLFVSKEMQKLGFTGIKDKGMDRIAEYAEQDVVATDELYQMQTYGYVLRPEWLEYLQEPSPARVAAHRVPPPQIVRVKNPMPHGKFVVEHEDLDEREKLELRYQEFPYLNATIDAERLGLPVQVDKIQKIRKQCAADRDKILKTIFQTAGKTLNLNSGAQLATLFEELGIENDFRTKKGQMKTDAQTLNKIQGAHPIVKMIQNYKSLEKLQTVYIGDPMAKVASDRLGLEYFVADDGCIHATANTVGAVTGRGSSSNPNLTQIPSAKDTYGLKDCFGAPLGKATVIRLGGAKVKIRSATQVVVCLDYAQLELRVGTLFCQDPVMIKALCDPKGDLHQITSDEFGVDRDPTAKRINFLLIFGGGAYVLSEQLTFAGVPTTPEQAKQYTLRYDQVYESVRPWRESLLEEHQENGFIQLFTGRKRQLFDVNWQDDRDRHKAETTLANNSVQGSGQDFLKAAIIRADWRRVNPDAALPQHMNMPKMHRLWLKDQARAVEKARRILKLANATWRLQVHDEAIWLCDRSAAEEVANICAKLMCMRHYFPPIKPYIVPLVADGGVGETWKEAKGKGAAIRVHYGFDMELDDINTNVAA